VQRALDRVVGVWSLSDQPPRPLVVRASHEPIARVIVWPTGTPQKKCVSIVPERLPHE
jgi:hypothetical protein